jgi:hypothetical protein
MSEKMLLLLGAGAVALFFVFSRPGGSLVGQPTQLLSGATVNNGAGLIGLENGFASLFSGLSGAVSAGTSAPTSSVSAAPASLPASAAFAGSSGVNTNATPGSISNLGSSGLINSDLLFQNSIETGSLNSTPMSNLLAPSVPLIASAPSLDFLGDPSLSASAPGVSPPASVASNTGSFDFSDLFD